MRNYILDNARTHTHTHTHTHLTPELTSCQQSGGIHTLCDTRSVEETKKKGSNRVESVAIESVIDARSGIVARRNDIEPTISSMIAKYSRIRNIDCRRSTGIFAFRFCENRDGFQVRSGQVETNLLFWPSLEVCPRRGQMKSTPFRFELRANARHDVRDGKSTCFSLTEI